MHHCCTACRCDSRPAPYRHRQDRSSAMRCVGGSMELDKGELCDLYGVLLPRVGGPLQYSIRSAHCECFVSACKVKW